jgi:hypothetical protein
MHDRVLLPRPADELLLGRLRGEVAVLGAGEPVGADDRVRPVPPMTAMFMMPVPSLSSRFFLGASAAD